uniref:Uncharacterized protein n=1 Tax=Megaviridae environmental sample TaxID=1737588 RepID=A0A5J6VK53_9VIRU|nr:MAG: hypothetical protein [Megaviridae environmental sample]
MEKKPLKYILDKLNISYNNFNSDNYELLYNKFKYDIILHDNYDWEKYVNSHRDLNKRNFSWEEGYIHYLVYGYNENRKIFCKNDYILERNRKDNIIWSEIKTKEISHFKALYQNYVNNYIKPIKAGINGKYDKRGPRCLSGIPGSRGFDGETGLDDKTLYQNNYIRPISYYPRWAHVHLYDIDEFDKIYKMYIKTIIKYFRVIVTYLKGSYIPKKSLIFIQIKNVEINEKKYVIEYLEDRCINYDNILFIKNIKYLDKYNLDKLLIKIIKSKDKFIALDICVESKKNKISDDKISDDKISDDKISDDKISDDKITNFFINKDTITTINSNFNEYFINDLIFNQINIYIIDENLNLNYKYINYNKKYSLLKSIKESDYKIIEHNINHDSYENVIIFCSHYKHYTNYVLKNIFDNLINYILNDSNSLLIIIYSSVEKQHLINTYKKNINLDNYIIVKDIKNDKVDFGKFCIGYKTLKYFNINSQNYHLMNDSFICSSSCESMYNKWRDNFKHVDFVGALITNQIKTHCQSWWLIMKNVCLDIYINELLSYDENFNLYYSKIKQSFHQYHNNWNDYLHLNEIYLENKLMKIINFNYLYDSGKHLNSIHENIFYDNDELYQKIMNEGLNIIKIKRIKNSPKRDFPVSFIHKKEYLDIFT